MVQAGSGAVTFGNPSSPGVPADLTKHTLLAQYNNIESVKKCFDNAKDRVACVIIEPIAGNMSLVPADKEFLLELRELCTKNGAILIFDEVMSGFRASLKGSYGILGIEADIVTFGKVIGGGMPVGAFAGKKEIMKHLSPEGPIYQAGTLSGNPVAMSAGLAMLKKLKSNPEIYKNLEEKAKKLMQGFEEISKENGIAIQTNVVGSMFGFFFNEIKPKNFDISKLNIDKFFTINQSKLALKYVSQPNLKEFATRGVLTPEHIIRTKRIPLVLVDDSDIPLELQKYKKNYKEYFNKFSTNQIMLDPNPKYIVIKDFGIISFAKTQKEADIINDIVHHTIKAVLQADMLGGYKSISIKESFDMEYWELEQAKLNKGTKK